MIAATTSRRFGVLFLTATTGVLTTAYAVSDPPFFQGLGGLPATSLSSTAACVSSNGKVCAGGSNSFAGSPQACAWSGGGAPIGLGDLPGNPYKSFARGISADGSVIVGYGNYGSLMMAEAFRYSNGSMQGLGFPIGMSNSWASDVSADGSTITVTCNISTSGTYWTRNGYLWTENGGFVQLPHIANGISLSASAISADGTTVTGAAGTTSAYEAYRWTSAGGIQLLGDLPGGLFDSRGHDISADGTVVVGRSWSAIGDQAFRWTAKDGMVGLGFVAGDGAYSSAMSTNADGSIVVGQGASTTFIWDAHYGMRGLAQVLADMGVHVPRNWEFSFGATISDDGRTIVGVGTNPQGNFEAFRARLRRPGDANSDGVVNVADLLSIINAWGECPSLPTFCPADVAPLPMGDGQIDVQDVLMAINHWGPP